MRKRNVPNAPIRQRKWHHETLINVGVGVTVWLIGSGLIAPIVSKTSVIASAYIIAVGVFAMILTMAVAKRLENKGGKND